MIGNKSTQEAHPGSFAIQSQDKVEIHITEGMSVQQMSEIFQLIKSEQRAFTIEAQEIIDRRLATFQTELFEEISSKNPKATAAFAEPDFHATLHDAQKSYARSDSDALHAVLTDLVFRRASETNRNRVSLILNQAIAKAEHLVDEDLASLALVFLVNHTRRHGDLTLKQLAEHIERAVNPLLSKADLSRDEISYLDAQGLIAPVPAGKYYKVKNFENILTSIYPSIFTYGISEEEARSLSSNDLDFIAIGILQPSEIKDGNFYSPYTRGTLTQLAASQKQGVWKNFSEQYTALISGRVPSVEDIKSAIGAHYPNFIKLSEQYRENEIISVRLSPIGVAIGHSYAAKVSNFEGDLGIWINR